jgi:hypothetical protein
MGFDHREASLDERISPKTGELRERHIQESAQWPEFAFMGIQMADENENLIELINALETHRINTLQDLRRIERMFAEIATPNVTGPMTSACSSLITLS